MSWIQTFTGKKFFPLAPEAKDICIEDIAHALSLTCRFGGHCKQFYSVAEHSVRASYFVPRKFALYALLHDAGEAYLPDVVHPIKGHMRVQFDIHPATLKSFRFVELQLLAEIHKALKVPPCLEQTEMLRCVDDADLCLLATEARDLMGPPPEPWSFPVDVQRLEERIWPMLPEHAEECFLSCYKLLTAPSPLKERTCL